jgi:hypothetical protein
MLLKYILWWVLNNLSTHMFIPSTIIWSNKKNLKFAMWSYYALGLFPWNGSPCLDQLWIPYIYVFLSYIGSIFEGKIYIMGLWYQAWMIQGHKYQVIFVYKKCEPMEICNSVFDNVFLVCTIWLLILWLNMWYQNSRCMCVYI